MDGPDDHWLEGGVIPLVYGADNGFLPEIDRVIDLLGADDAWLNWWRQAGTAPVLEIQIFILKATTENLAGGEQVLLGRKRHLVQIHVDFAQLDALEPDERRLYALPTVLEGISRCLLALKLPTETPPVPGNVRPAPLSAGTLRRRRLRELRGISRSEPQDWFPDTAARSAALTVRSVLRPEGQQEPPIPAGSPPDPTGRQLVVEIHLPTRGDGGVLPGERGYAFAWIDEVEEFLEDESSDGSFEIYDVGEDFVETYVFFISGASEELLLSVAARVASLPGIPSGAFAVVTDDQAEEFGAGRRIPLS